MPKKSTNEIPLAGGGRTAVFRKGNTVLRETGPWAPTVHTLLNHLEHVGYSGAPRVVGSGFDAQGRETLSYLEGEFVHPGPWVEDAMPLLGKLLRGLHDATKSFAVPKDAVWRTWHGRTLGSSNHVIGHCDTGPWNIVAQDGLPVALIDWEVAGPVDPLFELAHACWLNAQLHDDDIAELQGLADVETRACHVRAILDGYGLPRAQRVGFVDKIIEFAIHDAAAQAIEAKVTPETKDPEPLWGITWRTRSATWMLRHRTQLQQAL
ncbi:MAG: phosphotransferase [Pseudomonadota bacterium]